VVFLRAVGGAATGCAAAFEAIRVGIAMFGRGGFGSAAVGGIAVRDGAANPRS
jgi:hypothetical protein